MAQQGTSGEPSPQYEETTAPQNPPNAVVRPAVRSAALVTFLGGIVLLFLLVAAALIFFKVTDRPGDGARDPAIVGTTGEPVSEDTPGGFDPAPRPGDTNDELKYRGVDQPKQGPTPPLTGTEEKEKE